MLEILNNARGGGYLSKILAGISISQEFLSLTKLHQLEMMGYDPVKFDRSFRLIIWSDLKTLFSKKTKLDKYNTNVRTYEDLAAELSDDYLLNLYEKPDAKRTFLTIFQERFWAKGDHLRMDCHEDTFGQDTHFDTTQIKSTDIYVGNLKDKVLHLINNKKSFIMIGPSGTGKTTLASICSKDKRMIVISSRLIAQTSVFTLLSLLRALKPEILLIEDMQDILSNTQNYHNLLYGLEQLSGEIIVIGTIMTEKNLSEPGSAYYPGLRPGGRFEDLIVTKLPDESDRKLILQLYGAANLIEAVEKTDGLSPSYLKRLCEMIHEGQTLDDSILKLRLMSPKIKETKTENPVQAPDTKNPKS
jgi:hypothetical protein